MKIVIVGGTGLIGRPLVGLLRERVTRSSPRRRVPASMR